MPSMMYRLAAYVVLLLVPRDTSGFSSTSSRGGRVWGRGLERILKAPPRGGDAASTFYAHSLQEEETTTTLIKDPEEDTIVGDDGTVLLASHDEFIVSQPDNRKYRAVRLANNLEVLLVSSPESDVEAAAVHVQAGHMDDPAHRPGLAHFHEHMLFLGCEKYPSENEYEAFLSSHGGSSNAYTDMEDTNYYFSVTPHANDDDDNESSGDKTSSALAGGLDRLAQFFISPLFDESMVEREMRAIDSEYRNGLTSDSWRNFQLLKSSANPQHPFAKFGCGNYATLSNEGGIDGSEADSLPHHDLLEFWKTYYQTYNMRLAVVGRSSLDALQKTVEETFGSVPKSSGAPRRKKLVDTSENLFPSEHAHYGVKAFGAEQLNKMREVVPLTESRAIKIHFAIPPMQDPVLRKSRPHRAISHLLGHESPGSLHALLNEEGLLMGLSSGVGIDTSDFALFSLTLTLTPKGMAQKDHVLDLVFQWISLIQSTPPEIMEAYHDELRQISDTNFMFRENGDPTDFCSAAAELLFQYKPSDILVGSAKTGGFDAGVSEAILERLKPENALIVVIDSDADKADDRRDDKGEWQSEKWYKAKYREKHIPEVLATKWKSQEIDSRLRLPALNAYIPTDFSLLCETKEEERGNGILEESRNGECKPPSLLEKRRDLRLWHKLDRTWKVPKTAIRLSLASPNVYRSPRTITLNRIYQRVLNDDLNSFVYDASVAGCNYGVTCTPNGYRVSVTGYSEKLPFLLDTLTSRMLSLIQEMKEGSIAHPGLASKFNKACENLLRETKNYRLDSPYDVASYNSRLLLEERVWYLDNYMAEMEGEYAERDPLTMEECACVAEESLLGRVHADVLCIGNIDEKGAREVAEVVDSHFLRSSRPLSEVEIPYFRSLMLPTKAEAVKIFGPDVAGSAIPIIQQELAFSDSEENNAVEVIMQVGSDLNLGFEGVAILDLIAHIAYNSAFNQLRTQEQLGYLVSVFARKTVGSSWGLSVVVQSSVALPEKLEERIEEWLKNFRNELQETSPERIAMEAGAVVAQLMERDTKLSQEVSRLWGVILMTASMSGALRNPSFDRLERLSAELTVDQDADGQDGSSVTAEGLKQKVLDFFDTHLAADSERRRAMSARVYNSKATKEFDANVGKPGVLSNYDDIRNVKQFFPSWPTAPYWRTDSR